MKGFMKGFGIVGSAVGLAQYPEQVYNYGWKEGTRSTLEGFLDPFDIVPDGQGVGCALFSDCYAEPLPWHEWWESARERPVGFRDALGPVPGEKMDSDEDDGIYHG
jgi:hypothetical protein